MPASCRMRSSRRFTAAGRCIAAAWSTIAIVDRKTCLSHTPNGSPTPGSSPRSAASATAVTTLRRRPSTALPGRGDPSPRPLTIFRTVEYATLHGSTGSTIVGCPSPSATSRRPKPKSGVTPCSTKSASLHTLNPMAFGKPGAVRYRTHCTRREVWSAVENSCWSAVTILSLAVTVCTSAAPLVPGDAHCCSAFKTWSELPALPLA